MRTRLIRRAQGMTEYIVIVGLVAIALIGAVTSYKETVRVAIEGTDGAGGLSGGVGDMTDRFSNPTGEGGSTAPSSGDYTPTGGRDGDNRVIYERNGSQYVKDSGGNYVPYTP